jgi:serine/threonine protein kinase
MNFSQTIVGQHNKWALLEKLGEGDAGEVYLVETLLESRQAILKRPLKSSLSSEFMRQSRQIHTEASLLKALQGIRMDSPGVGISTPALLDQSPPEEGFGEGFFVVIDRARGYDLKTLRQVVYFGLLDEVTTSPVEGPRFFLETLSEFNQLPEAVLIRMLYALLRMLDAIHNTQVWDGEAKQSGIIWNDVKPEHLYWDPKHALMTIIDWGNGQFLEVDGVTRDRQHSMNDDYYQFVHEMGDFLVECCPELHQRLDWPEKLAPGEAYSAGAKPLQEKLAVLNTQVMNQIDALRAEEVDLYSSSRPSRENLPKIDRVQRDLVALGELPNLAGALNFHARLALQMTSENDLQAFRKVSERAELLEATPSGKWNLLCEIAAAGLDLDAQHDDDIRPVFSHALAAGVADDWASCLWELFTFIGSNPLPEWWMHISQAVRQVHLNLEQQALSPFNAISRLFYAIQTNVMQLQDQQRRSNTAGATSPTVELLARENLLKTFDEEVVKKWRQAEPAPPNADIDYTAIDRLSGELDAIQPGTAETLEKVLAQPKARARMILDAWERRDFEIARRGLPVLLLWDPDRQRLLSADRAIKSATQWLSKVRKGAGAGEAFYDYLTAVELAGRNLRTRVGSAKWLDDTLEVLKRLRKGTRPVDLTMDFPDVLNDIPWLNEHRSREILSLPRAHALQLERDDTSTTQISTLTGVLESRFGPEQDLHLTEPLDTWVPEARGSSARVYNGHLRDQSGGHATYAIKIMRPKYIDYSLPLFREEAHILTLIRDVPGVTPLVECGFLQFKEDEREVINDERASSVSALRGKMVRYSPEEVQNFLASMERYLAGGWLPYLALIKRDQKHNLMTYCDAGYTHGSFLPLRECLLLGVQICDILQVIHDRNIVYRDHKILHYYWEPETHGVAMIDWNISKRHPGGLSDAERQFDVVQFAARALHHILTGRPAPGALPLGPNRPEEIESASLKYAVSWTYDDERLPNRVKEIIEATLTQGYTYIRDLRRDLANLYEQIPENGPAQ